MSFLKSCFKPCLGGSGSKERNFEKEPPPKDVAERSPIQADSTAVDSVGGSTYGGSTKGSFGADATAAVNSLNAANKQPGGTADKPAPSMRWADFLNKYRAGSVKVDQRPVDMPEDEAFLRAPIPQDEKERQLAVYKYGFSDQPLHNEGVPQDGSEPVQENLSLFRICNIARTQFQVNVALISLLDDECQYFKSESGMEAHGMKELTQLPRDISFCGHTILNKAPMVILDTTQDWRMVNNPLVAQPPHVRFYAGVPIVAPEGYALGTLCIIGLEPKTSFDGGAKLQELADLAMNEIRSLYERNMAEKQARMADALNNFPTPQQAHANAIAAHVSSALDLEEARLRMDQGFTPAQQQAVLKAGKNQGLKVVAKTGTLQTAGQGGANAGVSGEPEPDYDGDVCGPPAHHRLPAASDVLAPPIDRSAGAAASSPQGPTGPLPTPPTNAGNTSAQQQVSVDPNDPVAVAAAQVAQSANPYDLSTLLIAQTLNLDLVYLLALDDDHSGGIATRVVSAHGLNMNPVFDAGLHFRALRSRSGLLYVHPDPESAVAKEMGSYVSGMLVPVLQLAPPAQGGYVLAAFTRKRQQIFAAEDLKFLRDFGISLMKWLLQADARAIEEGLIPKDGQTQHQQQQAGGDERRTGTAGSAGLGLVKRDDGAVL